VRNFVRLLSTLQSTGACFHALDWRSLCRLQPARLRRGHIPQRGTLPPRDETRPTHLVSRGTAEIETP